MQFGTAKASLLLTARTPPTFIVGLPSCYELHSGASLCTHSAHSRKWSLQSIRSLHQLQEWEYLLRELALYFLIYSESANLRHMPEALWFIFWLLHNSPERFNGNSFPAPTHPGSVAFALGSEATRGIPEKRCHLRNQYHVQIQQWRGSCGILGHGHHMRMNERVSSEGKRVLGAWGNHVGRRRVELGRTFCNRIVQ